MNTVDIFPWNHNFNTGITVIDDQHRELVRLLNQLARHLVYQSDLPALESIFDALSDYTVYHFRAEETLWQEYLAASSLARQHKQEHDSFVVELQRLKAEYKQQPLECVIEEILGFLARWLASHILENDRYLAMVVLAMQGGLSAEQAALKAKQELDGTLRVLIDIILSSYSSLTSNTLRLMRELVEHRRDTAFLGKLSLAVDQSPNSIIISDLDANIEFVNEAFVKTTGYCREEAIGQNPRILQSGETPESTYTEMWATLTRGETWKGELIDKRKDGSLYTEQAVIAPVFQADGKASHYVAIKENITDRKLAEARIQELLTEQKLMLESDLVGIAKINNRTVTWANPAFEKILGYDSSGLIGVSNRQHYPSDEAYHALAAEAYPVLQAGGVYRTQIQLARKNGELIWVELCGVMLNPASGDSLWSFIDITERKAAEAIVMQSEEKFRSIFDHSNDALMFMQGEYFADGNIRTLEMFKLDSLAELKTLTPIDLSPALQADDETSKAAAKRHIENAYQKGFEQFEWLHRRKDGDTFPAEVTLYAFELQNQTVLLANVRDISERKQAEKLLASSELKYRSLIEMAGDAIFITDAQSGLVLDCNRSAAQLLGKPKEAIIDLHQSAIHPPEKVEHYRRLFKAHIESGLAINEDVRVLHDDGHEIPVDIKATVIELNGSQVVLGVFRDESERKRAEIEMRIAATAFESQQAMLITDANKEIVRINKTFSETTGYQLEELIGANPSVLSSGRQDAGFYADMWRQINETGSWEGEIWDRRKNGEIYPAQLTVKAVNDKHGQVTNYVATHTDISQIKQHQREVEHISYHDPLTQLPNRRLLADRMQQALAHAKRQNESVCIVCIDLDGFKEVNDLYGHDAGDLLLIEAGRRMQQCIRGDDTVARLGGDEFVLLLRAIETHRDCELSLQRILGDLTKPFDLGNGRQAAISGSLGYTLYPQDDADADTLLRHADHAMYAAKQTGKNRFHLFDVELDNRIKANWGAIERIKRALDQQEFCLFIQPKVNLLTGQVAGAEALIRWRHPLHGLIPPHGIPAVDRKSRPRREIGKLGDSRRFEVAQRMACSRHPDTAQHQRQCATTSGERLFG